MVQSVESMAKSTTDAYPVRVLSPHEERIEQGEPAGLIGDAAQSKRARIHRMLEGFRDQPKIGRASCRERV